MPCHCHYHLEWVPPPFIPNLMNQLAEHGYGPYRITMGIQSKNFIFEFFKFYFESSSTIKVFWRKGRFRFQVFLF